VQKNEEVLKGREMDKIIDVFEQALNGKYLVSLLLHNQDWENRTIGYVLGYDEKDVAIQVVDKLGQKIKQIKISRSKLAVIELFDEYTFNLQQIIVNDIFQENNRAKYFEFFKNRRKIEKLIELEKMEKVCSFIFSNDNYVTGFIHKVIEDGIVIQCIGYNGNYDGLAIVDFHSLKRIRMEGWLEKKITYLSSLPNKRRSNW
jgi:hypothetical protein